MKIATWSILVDYHHIDYAAYWNNIDKYKVCCNANALHFNLDKHAILSIYKIASSYLNISTSSHQRVGFIM